MQVTMIADGDARALALTRMLVAAASALTAVETFIVLARVLDGRLAMPAAVSMPFPSGGLLVSWLLMAFAASILLAVGWAAGWAAGGISVLNVIALLWDQQVYTNHMWLITLTCAYLAFAKSDTAWSLAASKRSDLHSEPPVPFWPQLLMMTQLTVCYFFAAISKVNEGWLAGQYLEGQIRLAMPEILIMSLPVVVILTELFIALGLWGRISRLVALPVGISLHLSIVGLMHNGGGFVSFSLVCLSIYPLYAVRPSWSSIGIPGRASRIVIWDDGCSFCRRWVLLFKRLDWFGVHRFIGSSEPEAFLDTRVTREKADEALQLLSPTWNIEGFSAVRRILSVCPLTAWLTPLLSIPLVSRVGDRLYRRTAARRSCSIG